MRAPCMGACDRAPVEAAANILTNPALDPFGMIPEFKFCAAKMEPAAPRQQAAE